MVVLLCSSMSDTRRLRGLDDTFASLTALVISEQVILAFNSLLILLFL